MINIGILVFEDIEELDFIGPFEVLSYINKTKPYSTNVWIVSDGKEIIKG